MMKKIYTFVALLFSLNLMAQKSFYDLKTSSIDGELFDFAQLKGKKVMIVNTASKCGYTPQYKDLQEVYNKYKDNNFVIIGFPANDFGKQEPGSNDEIVAFCEKNYGVSFPMMSKISVKGSDMDAIYKWLTDKNENGVSDATVKWNFNKFLIDEKGNWVEYLGSSVNPNDKKIISWIEAK
jgi:glutathione peroxidase